MSSVKNEIKTHPDNSVNTNKTQREHINFHLEMKKVWLLKTIFLFPPFILRRGRTVVARHPPPAGGGIGRYKGEGEAEEEDDDEQGLFWTVSAFKAQNN